MLKNLDRNWYQLVKNVCTEIDGWQQHKLPENFVIDTCLIGLPPGWENSMKNDCCAVNSEAHVKWPSCSFGIIINSLRGFKAFMFSYGRNLPEARYSSYHS